MNGSTETMSTSWDIQQTARTALIIAVVAVGVWMLWRFLPALTWAGVLAIATWPLRDGLSRTRERRTRPVCQRARRFR